MSSNDNGSLSVMRAWDEKLSEVRQRIDVAQQDLRNQIRQCERTLRMTETGAAEKIGEEPEEAE